MRNPLTRKLLYSKFARVTLLTLIASASVLLFVTSGRTSSSPLIISEFRFRGPNGANDEFVEIYNQTDSNFTVNSSDASSAAKTFCQANNGAAPAGYFVIGDGPIVGPKQ